MSHIAIQIGIVIVAVMLILTGWAMSLSRRIVNRDVITLGCKVPPYGWACSRMPGHAGPCAATHA